MPMSLPPSAQPGAAATQASALTLADIAALRLPFATAQGRQGVMVSLPALARYFPAVARLPLCLRVVLESVLRHCDGHRVGVDAVLALAQWQPRAQRLAELPFVVARVILQDFTGVPLLADLAAMRQAALRLGRNPALVEPLVPVDLVVDHSVMVDHAGSAQALDLNLALEFQRNRERYQFLKWGMQAFKTFGVVPPGFGIVHQVNLEFLARGVHRQAQPGSPPLVYADTLVGTDSHTTMINAIGTVGWGVGGIEAEAAMLGQPIYMLTPDVVGVELSGRLREGVTATDLVLTLTEQLRREQVVGQFVEFCGAGTASLALTDRATIANMAPEFGATLAYFPVDEHTLDYFAATGRSEEEIDWFAAWFKAQQLFGVAAAAAIDYSRVLTLDLDSVEASVAGPRRPQDRIGLSQVAPRFEALLAATSADNGFAVADVEAAVPVAARAASAAPAASMARAAAGAVGAAQPPALRHGDVLIAAITSCTNTSNPGLMLAAGLLAKKAVQAGLAISPRIKTSLAPGSRMVTRYLQQAGLLPFLEQLGFNVVAYGCTTCIGNAGDLTAELNTALADSDLVCAAVLSGNRNFEARIHPRLKANFLASPPLVLAYALAGNVRRNLVTQPLGSGRDGQAVWLRDIWPSTAEIAALLPLAADAQGFRDSYGRIGSQPGALWQDITGSTGRTYDWPASSYIAEPPFLQHFTTALPAAPTAIRAARILGLFGDSITTDHISPAGNIAPGTPAAQWLQQRGVLPADFNSYGARRGQHEVMVRGTFANVRLRNLMLPPRADGSRVEGGQTLVFGDAGSQPATIHAAAEHYSAAGTPTVVLAGAEYGTGSSRDWAAKGTALLGIRAVVAGSFERIHRSNLVGMGVLPLQFKAGITWQSLGLRGDETVDVVLADALRPLSDAELVIHRDPTGLSRPAGPTRVAVTLRIDTPIEVAYISHGGILPYVLRGLLAAA